MKMVGHMDIKLKIQTYAAIQTTHRLNISIGQSAQLFRLLIKLVHSLMYKKNLFYNSLIILILTINFKHTLGTSEGSFVFLDASTFFLQPSFQKARLLSSIQQKSAGSCLHFFYHAYGFYEFF